MKERTSASSYDLTAATDRFPVKVIEMVINKIYDQPLQDGNNLGSL